MLVAGVVLLSLPPEYLREGDRAERHWLARTGRTLLGVVLVGVGVVLSVPGVPGQGLLTIVAGLALIEFPGRHRVISAILSRPTVLRAANRLRVRFKRQPFA